MGIIVFYFFLNSFGDFLERRFVDTKLSATHFLQNTSPDITDNALEMVEKEVELFIYRVVQHNRLVFQLLPNEDLEKRFHQYIIGSRFEHSLVLKDQYKLIKNAEGEIFSFYAKMGLHSANEATSFRLHQLMASVRNAMYAAKGIKDILDNKAEFSNSINAVKYENFIQFQQQQAIFYDALTTIFLQKESPQNFTLLQELLQKAKLYYQDEIIASYKEAGNGTLRDIDIATVFNVNRELYSSNKAIILALKDFLFDADTAERFEQTE